MSTFRMFRPAILFMISKSGGAPVDSAGDGGRGCAGEEERGYRATAGDGAGAGTL